MLARRDRARVGPVALRWPKTPARHVGRGRGRQRSRRRARSAPATTSASSRSGRWSRRPRRPPTLLDAREISTTVWDVRVVPLDTRMLADARRHALVVTAEDGIAEGGVGSLLASSIARGEGDPLAIDHARHAARVPPARQARRPARQPRPRRPGHRRVGAQGARRHGARLAHAGVVTWPQGEQARSTHQEKRFECSSTDSCTNSPTSTRKRRRNGSSRSTR